MLFSNFFIVLKRKTPKFDFYGMSLLYQTILDGSPLNQDYFSCAFDAMVTVAKNPHFKPVREKYIGLCCDNVKRGISVPQSIYLALHILTSYTSSGFFGIASHCIFIWR